MRLGAPFGWSKVCGAAILALSLLSGCVNTSVSHLPEFKRDEKLRMVLMPIDVELSEMTAGGALEPKADWTAEAQKHLFAALEKAIRDRRADPISYQKIDGDAAKAHGHDQLVKLHSRIGGTVLVHHYQLQLPNKEGKFDWTLGSEARRLREDFGSDYALFVYVRDSYTSGGRAVAVALAAVLFGVALPTGQQLGFASLVDLNDGRIVWFNRLARGTGDLRNGAAAEETVAALLSNFPK